MGYTPPQLEVRKISGGWSMFPPDYTTTDDLTILPNGTDTYAKIQLLGAGNMVLTSVGNYQFGNTGATGFLVLGYATPDVTFLGLTDKNLFLQTQGTGKVKFGTFTASGDVAVNGSVDILDSSGNARKLATIA